MENQEIHHYHHNDARTPVVSIKLERNTKGYNYEVSVSDANSVREALDLAYEASNELEQKYPLKA